ncbi:MULTISPECIES: hypothetical protein [unclassified Sphingomonas]|jgi:hypothetical protein|uniref:hypothetical protein n=1 Tax=unclassified Sphingomonas TaxID=196159 RepID=UPI00053D60F5|nr:MULTISPECIES: hypothetical protein [unclassified Sphingomonas]
MAEGGKRRDGPEDADSMIEWVLANPRMSLWLKNALRSALDQDPFDVLNDLEILKHLSAARCRSALNSYYAEHDCGAVESVNKD